MRRTVAALAGMIAGTILANAADRGQWGEAPDSVRKWFQLPRIAACCSIADGERTRWEMRPDGYYASVPWQKEWLRIPNEAIVIDPQNPNPTGDAVIWLNESLKQVRCFAPGSNS